MSPNFYIYPNFNVCHYALTPPYIHVFLYNVCDDLNGINCRRRCCCCLRQRCYWNTVLFFFLHFLKFFHGRLHMKNNKPERQYFQRHIDPFWQVRFLCVVHWWDLFHVMAQRSLEEIERIKKNFCKKYRKLNSRVNNGTVLGDCCCVVHIIKVDQIY